MPVYEYRCVSCASTFEKLVQVSPNGEPTQCPECGGRADKQFSTFAALGVQQSPSGGGCCGGGGGCACAT